MNLRIYVSTIQSQTIAWANTIHMLKIGEFVQAPDSKPATTNVSNKFQYKRHLIQMSADYKYEITVHRVEGRQRIPAVVKEKLVEAGMTDVNGKIKFKGVSPKMVKRMKQEYVECPIFEKNIHFVQCFVCSNFQSRVKGKVLCKGEQIT